MDEAEKKGRLLTSWKDIAAYLHCGVRTARRYEARHGLPVFRLGPSGKGRIFAYERDLEEWLAARRESGMEERPDTKSRWRVIGAVAGLAVLILGFLALSIRRPGQPAEVEFSGNRIRVLDGKRRPLWSYSFEKKLAPPHYMIHLLSDIDGDKNAELLLSAVLEGGPVFSSELFCFSSGGKVLWTFRPGKKLVTPEREFLDDFLINILKVENLFGNGRKQIIVGSHHSPWEPAQLVVLDHRSRKLGEYWNGGYLRMRAAAFEDLDRDGVKELLFGGENNYYGRACIVVLDPRQMSGQSPTAGIPEHRFAEIEDGVEEQYVLLPRSWLCERYELRNAVEGISIDSHRQTIEAVTTESRDEKDAYRLRYLFDFELYALEVRAEDVYIQKMKELLALRQGPGFNPDDLRNCRDRVEYWTGKTWSSSPKAPRTLE